MQKVQRSNSFQIPKEFQSKLFRQPSRQSDICNQIIKNLQNCDKKEGKSSGQQTKPEEEKNIKRTFSGLERLQSTHCYSTMIIFPSLCFVLSSLQFSRPALPKPSRRMKNNAISKLKDAETYYEFNFVIYAVFLLLKLCLAQLSVSVCVSLRMKTLIPQQQEIIKTLPLFVDGAKRKEKL